MLETDGYRLERFKAFYNADYGVLASPSDHGLMQKCDAVGSGDSGLYPGGSPETGEQTREGKRRYNTEIRYCDMRHNTAGYSGTDGNAVWLHHNDLYDNANGFTTDVFTASGHPGFPQDSDLLEKNEFYSNNFNPYRGGDVRPTVPMPVGTGMWIAGGNNNTSATTGSTTTGAAGRCCSPFPTPWWMAAASRAFPGCEPRSPTQDTSTATSSTATRWASARRASACPNGDDFWWDPFPGSANNCWFNNTGKDGDAASITSTPDDLPSDCSTSLGDRRYRRPGRRAVRLCQLCPRATPSCPWFTTPPKPTG